MWIGYRILVDIRIFLWKHPINFKNWGKVALAGMSDGTQDQLYLALRLASLEKFSAEGEPLPLPVDDALVNFDNAAPGQL